jgi:hypothetical protein
MNQQAKIYALIYGAMKMLALLLGALFDKTTIITIKVRHSDPKQCKVNLIVQPYY